MVFLYGSQVRIVVMLNVFHGKCPNRILEDLIEIDADYLNSQNIRTGACGD
jgi:hypothetical protein